MNKIFFIFFIFCFLVSDIAVSEEDVFELEASKIEFISKKNIIVASGKAKAWDQEGNKIFSDKIIYDKKNYTIKTFENSKFSNEKINISAKNFYYDIKNKIVEANQNVEVNDFKKNAYFLKNLKYFLNKDLIEGDELVIKSLDQSFFKSKKIKIDLNKKISYISNSNYTSCSKIKDSKNNFCPDWSISSSSTEHDQNKKELTHKNAILKVKNIPILYLPTLTHPDPSVKRKSGFLTPFFKSSNNVGRTISLPYFINLAEDKDITFSPIYYFSEKPMILTNYRQKFKNSYLEVDTSYWQGYKKLEENRLKGSKNHFFLDFINKEKKELSEDQLSVKFQRISDPLYHKINKINTKLINQDMDFLESKIEYKKFDYKNNYKFTINSSVNENLSENSNNKYEYIFPSGDVFYGTKKKNHNLSFISSFQGRQYEVDKKEFKLKNTLDTASDKILSKNIGLSTVFKTSFQNINYNTYHNDNSLKNINNYFTLGMENSIPFYKKNINSLQILSPKIFLKHTTGSQKDLTNQKKELEYYDIFSMNRSNDTLVPETGSSAGIGFDWEKTTFETNNEIKTKNIIEIGQVINNRKMNNMPETSSLNEKFSNVVGRYSFNFYGDENYKINNETDKKIDLYKKYQKNNLALEYKFNLDNNLNDFNKNSINLNAIYNSFYIGSNFLSKSGNFTKEKTLETEIEKKFNKNLYFSVKQKKDLFNNLSESSSAGLVYENDCISMRLDFQKNYYSTLGLKNENSLVFNITIKPFGETIAPDFSSFVK